MAFNPEVKENALKNLIKLSEADVKGGKSENKAHLRRNIFEEGLQPEKTLDQLKHKYTLASSTVGDRAVMLVAILDKVEDDDQLNDVIDMVLKSETSGRRFDSKAIRWIYRKAESILVVENKGVPEIMDKVYERIEAKLSSQDYRPEYSIKDV